MPYEAITIASKTDAPITITLPSSERGAICDEFRHVHQHLTAITNRQYALDRKITAMDEKLTQILAFYTG